MPCCDIQATLNKVARTTGVVKGTLEMKINDLHQKLTSFRPNKIEPISLLF